MEALFPTPLNLAGSVLYGMATKIRSAGFESGLFPTIKVDGLSVVSIGNLRAGGSGKTPFAMHVAAKLQGMGHSTALVQRGYRGRLEGRGGLASRGFGQLFRPEEMGDEAFEAALRLDGVMVLVGADRVASARRAKREGARVVVLDDGFQHRRLHRDLNILLACPEDLNPTTKLLPAGPLREPSFEARRADLIAGFESDWLGVDDKPDVLFDYVPSCIVRPGGQTLKLADCKRHRVFLISGVARPKRFQKTARLAGFDIVGERAYGDHHRFSAREISDIDNEAALRGAQAILTTEKDLARLLNAKTGLPIWALRIDLEIRSGANLLEKRLEDIAKP